MGKQHKKVTTPAEKVNNVDWGKVARELFKRGLIPETMTDRPTNIRQVKP